MKVITHYRIAKIVAAEHGLTAAQGAAFRFGTLVPDMLPFYHPHYYKTSGDYVFRRLCKLVHKRSLYSYFMRGVMAHYVTDFCCSAHAEGLGNVKEHLVYEKKLENYLKSSLGEIRQKFRESEKATDLHEVINLYTCGERFDCETDIYSALQACAALLYCYAPADRRPLIAALNGRRLNFDVDLNEEITDAIKNKHGKHI